MQPQVYAGLSHRGNHLRAERVLGFYTAGLVGPPVLSGGTLSKRCEVVLGHRGSPQVASLRHIRRGPFPPSRLAQRTRPKALRKLLLIYADGARDADYTV